MREQMPVTQQHPHGRPVPMWRMTVRAAVITVVTVGGFSAALVAMAAGLLLGGRKRSQRFGCHVLVVTLQVLGPTFVKFGQTSSTRRDAMPAELADELAALHDAVRPMSKRHRTRALHEADIGELAEVSAQPIASGSIACVYRGVLTDGRVVAVKLKRPGIDGRMHADIALFQHMMRLFQRMPKMRGMPMADLVGYVGQAILGQLDFPREARNVARLRSCLSSVPQIRVPMVYPEISRPNCLIFEYLPGLDAATPLTLPAGVRRDLANRALQAAHQMMFVDGFVHCDLHPGNVYLTGDQRVVILDAGYCVQLPDRVRDLIGEFFGCLANGHGRRCGEIVLESAVHPEHADVSAFIAGMEVIVKEWARPRAQFDMKAFGDAVFKLQQAHHIYAASDFAFPLMSLNVLDGTVRGFAGPVDFKRVGYASVHDGT